LTNQTTERSSPAREEISLEQAIQCARIGEDNKAKDIVILDLRKVTPIFDFFVLMTGGSRRQLHTLAEESDAYMRSQGETRLTIQGYQASRWIVQDYGDIIVHVFDAESREYYALEDLWADAPHIDWKR
jgi:ribosome-associated protein